MKRLALTSILIFILITIGTVVAILYAKGYRVLPGAGKATLEGTGLLVLTSRPDGARVYINNNLTTATNNTINLAPGDYDIKIEKDGYFPWYKKVSIKKEIVREANATLFPNAPKLEAITITGSQNPVIDATGTFIAYTTASASAAKNGAYAMDMNARPILTIGGITSQLVNNTLGLAQSTLEFSPEGDQVLATLPGITPTYYLFSSKSFTQTPQNVTITVAQIRADWQALFDNKTKKVLDTLPKKVRTSTLTYFKDYMMSPDNDKIFYTASASAALPILKEPRWMSVNSTPETRELKEGAKYVYDIKEDRNYLVFEALENEPETGKYMWHPDSRHVIFVKNKTINIIEYDGKNQTTLYAGPFVDNLVFAWPDGSNIVILTNLNIPDAPYNLYRVSLK